MHKALGVGIIGCGNISTAYLSLASMFRGYDIRAVADVNMDTARTRALEFDVRADTVEDLLAAADIDLIVNLTIPAAHGQVSKAILDAGKHVYSEKPFVLSLAEGQELAQIAAVKGLRIGSAPDTFLGGSHQMARKLIDDGAIGTVTSGVAVVMSHGMEDWHPNPDFFFQQGGGPVLDIGPYYICNLVQMLGPIKQVTSFSGKASDTRTIGSGPRKGETVPVETPTTIHAVLAFESGAIITLLASWDVWANANPTMELYGTKGTMTVPDPNFFGGDVTVTQRNDAPQTQTGSQTWAHPFGIPNFEETKANYRGAGLADMVEAINTGRAHRCNDTFASHVVDVMTSILKAGETGQVVTLTTSCTRPDALEPAQAQALLSDKSVG
ncbi:MAG: Gfo/Idh/MocA family protein [Paracoccaceae bacterium]